MMPLTEGSVWQCYRSARQFYKNKPKSDNKVYGGDAALEKRENRATRILEGAHFPSLRQAGMTLLQAGTYLRQTQNGRGNCGEMTCVALSFVAEMLPDVASCFCLLTRPANHNFLIVGAPPPPATIASLITFDEESYVLDVWAGVFCRTCDYYFFFVAKMQRWSFQGKYVRTRDGVRNPFGAYAQEIVNAVVQAGPPHSIFQA
jgi:hypothetical protein